MGPANKCDSHLCFNLILDNILQRQKLVSVEKKQVSNFAHFPSPHLHLMQTPLWWLVVVDICKIVSKFLQALGSLSSWCNLRNQSSESGSLHKAENTDNLFDYQCFSKEKFVLRVELGGVEPPSKQVTNTLSTCLFFDWFSSRTRTKTPKSDLIP